MEKKVIGVLLMLSFIFGSINPLLGQPNRRERVEAERVAFITKRMELSPKQAQGFWPLYTEYERTEKQIRQKYRSREIVMTMDEEEAQQTIEKRLRMEEELLALKKNYFTRFKTVISSKQLLLMLKANAEFKQYLLEEIRRRRSHRLGGK